MELGRNAISRGLYMEIVDDHKYKEQSIHLALHYFSLIYLKVS